MTLFYRIIRTIAYPIVRLVFRIKPVGLENVPKKGGVILCCNHTSFTDIAFLIIMCKRQIFFMAKEELFKNVFIRWLFTHMGAFSVKRGTGGGEAIETANKLIKKGKIMGIFPEGTRSKDGKPARAKSGVAIIAAQAEAPVLPVSIYREGKIRPFCKVTMRFGDVIPAEELKIDINKREDLRRASSHIMDKIKELWEVGF